MSNRYSDQAASLGEPSYVWRAGQERRMQIITAAAGEHLQGTVLDNGCGVGMYLKRLAGAAEYCFGLEFDRGRALEAMTYSPVVNGASEALPFPADTFDLILSHEVLEHVEDDRQSLEEMIRILRKPNPQEGKPGGRLLLFLPNRGYPFETHGVFLRGRYHFGNIPLVNYLPRNLRDRLAPHVRVYGKKDLDHLLAGLPIKVLQSASIFGAYDNVIARYPRWGRFLRNGLQSLETTPLGNFGLSHFRVLERIN